MKKLLLAVFLSCSFCLFGQSFDTLSIRAAIEQQMAAYPESTLQDIYKSFYQDRFGPGHMISDTASARSYLMRESLEMSEASAVYYEPTGSEGRFVRVYLSAVSDGLITADQLLDAFVRSANMVQETESDWETEWRSVVDIITKHDIQVNGIKEDAPSLEKASRNHQAVHHSRVYNTVYHPHYRIVERAIFEKELMPLINSGCFHKRYTLKQVVVLSRHNIRSPLSGRSSRLQRITPHEWCHWSSAPGELSLRGGALETMMGQYFRKWLVSEGLMQENEIPAEGTMRFYANSLQRTIATAQYFSSGLLPVANVRIEHHCEVGKMDSVFAPQITDDNEAFKALAQQQIAAMGGEKELVGIGDKMTENYKTLERVLDMDQSKACLEGDTCGFRTDDTHVYLVKYREPGMGGSLRLACQTADALVLQYYEEPDAVKAAFGDTLTWEDWESISAIKDWYGDVLFTAPAVACQVARPLLRTMLEELQNDSRRFTFLCGHDSNIGSVLAALDAEDYSLPQTIEKKTPIGCKLVIEKWENAEGQLFASLNLVYQSTEQLRNMTLLVLEDPPMIFPIHLKGLSANTDGLYPYKALVDRFVEKVEEKK